MNKVCKRCDIEKCDTDFTVCRSNKDGLSIYCKKCTREISKPYNLIISLNRLRENYKRIESLEREYLELKIH